VAEVTVELRNLLKTNFKLFDFDYKFDDLQFKKELEQHVIDFYFFYEIGQETPDRFKHQFKARWLRMIDYYNELYNTTLLSYNPLTNYTVQEALEQLSNTNNETENTTNSTTDTEGNTHTFMDADNKASDYPQQAIAGGDFLSAASNTISDTTSEDSAKTTGKTTGTAINNGTTNMNYSKTIEGMTGTTYQELVMKQRATLIRITNMVIEELKPCFILVY